MAHFKMILIRFSCVFLAVSLTAANSSSDFSAKEKIRIHREWLERRARTRSQYGQDSHNITKSLYSHRKHNIQSPIENDVTKVSSEHNWSKDRIIYKGVMPQYKEMHEDQGSHLKTTSTTPPTTTTMATTTTTTTESPTSTFIPEEVPQTTMTTSTTEGTVEQQREAPRRRVRKYPHWGPWSTWSDCSRSCGGGVMYQQRRCIARRLRNPSKRFISRECTGLYKRYHLCNEQPCPEEDVDFRQEQCSRYDDKSFQGKTYRWEPYIKDDAECELNCKPLGMKYFATLNETVIDGTACSRPAEYYRKNYRGKAICVEGVCKALHTSGLISGAFANTGTVHCGGLICRPISGLFTKNNLKHDYVHVATIPAGASNISITELKNSDNFLVLRSLDKTYVLNGDYKFSPSGTYEAAGTVFDYHRIDGFGDSEENKIEGVTEWITCTGPTLEPIHLMVFMQDDNPGVKYEYLLPVSSNSESVEDFLDDGLTADGDYGQTNSEENQVSLKSGDDFDATSVRPLERRRRRFIWKVVGYSPCSKSCGGGTQTPVLRCSREGLTRYFSQRRCHHIEKPTINENLLRCNTQPCPAYWRVEEWNDCHCFNGEGLQEREVRCVQELATGIIIQVNSAACMEEEPPSRKVCDCPKPRRTRPPHRQRLHAQSRGPESIIANATVHRAPKSSKAGVWLASDWNQHCSAECGVGLEYRSIFCDRTKPHSERCDYKTSPETTRTCENERTCGSGDWFTNSWGQCGGDCFNLTKTREVICIRNQLIVDDEECNVNEKPETLKNCSLDEVPYCRPRWHYSEWTECSKSCDGGTQRRTVKCLDLDIKENRLVESQNCKYTEREPIYRACNTQKCKDIRVDLIQNDVAAECEDDFSNCQLVLNANLCQYEYYRSNCCYTCTRSHYNQ